MKKLYLSSTTLLFNLCEEPDYGRAVENLAMNSSQSQFFQRKGNFEVDCVTVKKGSIVPVESKYSSDMRKREIKELIKFLKDFLIDVGCVVTRDMQPAGTGGW